MGYAPSYDTKIQTKTVIERIETWHTDYIDWNYPFADEPNGSTDKDRNAKQEQYLLEIHRAFSEGETVYASSYGGWPRIWERVIRVGMCSAWPYWRPRPTVLVSGTLGPISIDWYHITGVDVRQPTPRG